MMMVVWMRKMAAKREVGGFERCLGVVRKELDDGLDMGE